MNMPMKDLGFQAINTAYNTVFQPGRISIGLVVALESYAHGPVPTMVDQLARIQRAERLGFSAIWLRDVPFNVPSFGDAGQLFDPFVYLGLLASQTSTIALGVSSIVLPLRHPAHVAKAAASVDVLSGGRLLLGVASGDRPEEYPALNISYEKRGQHFRDSLTYIRKTWERNPVIENAYGKLNGQIDVLPKPESGRVPLLITGSSQQSQDWLAQNGDGWMIYPRRIEQQKSVIEGWNVRVRESGRRAQPIMQPLYIDLADNPDEMPQAIHLGFRMGSKQLSLYIKALESIGVNHVALNLRFNQHDIESTLERLAQEVLVNFPHT